MKQYLEAGKIVNTRGIAGEIKVESYCDSPAVFGKLKKVYFDDAGKVSAKITKAGVYDGYAYLKLEGVTTIEQAQKLKNRVIFADRDEIPKAKGSVFIADLIGLAVYDADTGVNYGKVAEVINRGASDIYRIVNGEKEYLIPAVKEFVVGIDLEKGVALRPIEGMIDAAEEVRE